MHYPRTFVGIDVHANKNEVFAFCPPTGEFRRATLTADPAELAAWLSACGLPGPFLCVYEAGPTGYWLARELDAAGHGCVVAATSKLAKRNDGRKNDRVDAEWLARQLAAGAVVPVPVPAVDLEGFRSLVRMRDDQARLLSRAKQRATSFLLAKGAKGRPTKKNWTKGFRRWAATVAMPTPLDREVLDLMLAEVAHHEQLLLELDGRVAAELAARPALASAAARLRCLPGVGAVTASLVVAECGDLSRFGSGAAFACWCGLVPSGGSTGDRHSTGPLTRRGNGRVRRALTECAQQYAKRLRPRLSEDASVPLAVREHALKGGRRLLRRSERLAGRGKASNKRKGAVARELVCWMYHIATM